MSDAQCISSFLRNITSHQTTCTAQRVRNHLSTSNGAEFILRGERRRHVRESSACHSPHCYLKIVVCIKRLCGQVRVRNGTAVVPEPSEAKGKSEDVGWHCRQSEAKTPMVACSTDHDSVNKLSLNNTAHQTGTTHSMMNEIVDDANRHKD